MVLKSRWWLVLLLQLVLVFCSLVLAWALQLDRAISLEAILWNAFPLLAFARLVGIAMCNLMHGYWRYTGISDIVDVLKAVVVGSAGFIVAERAIVGHSTMPLPMYFLEPLITVVALAGVRGATRAVLQSVEAAKATKSALVVGAGAGGAMLAFELQRNGYRVVAFVDDDREKRHIKLHGVSVVGSVDDIPTVCASHGVEEILIAIPSATAIQMRRITEKCAAAKVPYRMIPGLKDLVEGDISVSQLREVRLEDLLGRESVQLDLTSVRRQLSDSFVLVTGAAGSIGSELAAQILSYGPAKLICVDHDESGLFFVQQELQRAQFGNRVEYVVANVENRARMSAVFQSHKVRFVFHAAAYKHVPLMETNVIEAVRNNILGLNALLDVAEDSGCEAFVLISTDKAVNPTSVMGCTKRVCELVMASRPTGDMRRVTVRFGNVLGSQGSVVPVLQEQIRTRGSVTVTHPDITRFFMTIPEAVSLVLQAFTVGKQGDILVLDMGSPMRIADLARTLIRLMGKTEDEVQIVYTGLRRGEKLFEELFYDYEAPAMTECGKVLRTRPHMVPWSVLTAHVAELQRLALTAADPASLRAKLKTIVPEFVDSSGERGSGHQIAAVAATTGRQSAGHARHCR